ncbi:MAG TPA: discoidin domain-containing protein [Rhodanobacteraceae bacterium]|nr:discoidin domain-containing protein [Rhodanobacteraceae bacterium]
MSVRFIALVALFFSTALAAIEPPRTLDDFSDASRWKAAASDQVSATLRKTDGGLCLAYDFHGVSGYASMRRALALDYPADYEFDVRVRGHAPENALQFKLTDAANENVWWVNRGAFSPPADWTPLRFRKREVSFAWGPRADHDLHRSDAIEFTVYADKGGSGKVCFAGLVFRERPPLPAVLPNPMATASSTQRGAPATNAIDGDPATFWQSALGGEQSLTIDLGLEREFGGLVLHWHGDAFASKYEVALSDDAKDWHIVRRVTVGNGGADPLYLPESEARYVRISMHGREHGYALDEIDFKNLAFGASANAFFSALAKSAPRGWYPRGFYDEQTYWTVVGVDGGHETGLFSEDGALEVARGGFSIAPTVADADGTLSTWADATITHTLADGYLPIPSAVWRTHDFALTTTAFAAGKRGASTLVARYVLENTGDAPRDLTLALVVQPFQVNPAVQFLNTPGGVSPIHDLALDGTTLSVDGKPRAFALARPDAGFGSPFDAGIAVEHIAEARNSTDTTFATHDGTGLASGALLYRVKLAPHASATFALAIPLEGDAIPPTGSDAAAWSDSRLRETAATWRATLNRASIRIPNAQPLADTLRTALADILISREGPALRPGTRSYARSWIRDGTMMSSALLRLGHDDAARDYLKWYAPYQFASGKVPCCVDARGSDPVPENDSHGELIHLAGEVWRYTHDRATLESMWPHVDAAARYMDSLRASERGETNVAFRGLMPPSISHEGYSAKPMHSYWDDFWALTGYDDAVMIADALGKSDDAKRLVRSRDEFRGDLYASIRRSVADHGIDYLPGCAELGDFDATSTTIALSPAGQQSDLPQDLLHATFERYWKQFEARANGTASWKDYTPYEWRTVGTFVRLGWRDRAQVAIDFFMHDRRPAEWNQWAEVVGRDPRESRFVGDMPHGWVASDFIRSALDVFAYERESDESLVIAAGVPEKWLQGEGIAIEHLRTPFGKLSYRLARRDGRVRLDISGDGLRIPAGGIVLVPPSVAKDARATINARTDRLHEGSLRIRSLPATIEIDSL